MAYGWWLSNICFGLLIPAAVLALDTIPGLLRCTDVGRQTVEAMTTMYGPLLGIANGDLFDYILMLSVYLPLMVSCWVPWFRFQLTTVIIFIWLCAYNCTVGVYMATAQLPPGPAPLIVLVLLLMLNTVWRSMDLRETFGGQVSDSHLVGWAISCFMFVFLGLSGILVYRSPMLVASAELMRDKMEYFAQDGHGQWPLASHKPLGFVADQTLADAAAEEQASLPLVPWWAACGIMWAMFATIAALSPQAKAAKATKVSAAKADPRGVKLLG